MRNSLLEMILTGILLLLACYYDYRYLKVPNKITFPGMLAGILYSLIFCASTVPLKLIYMAVFMVVGAFHIVGMGDIKLIMAVIAFSGYRTSIWMVLCGCAIMLIYGLLFHTARTISSLRVFIRSVMYRTPIYTEEGSIKYPFAVFLTCGYFFTQFFLK